MHLYRLSRLLVAFAWWLCCFAVCVAWDHQIKPMPCWRDFGKPREGPQCRECLFCARCGITRDCMPCY